MGCAFCGCRGLCVCVCACVCVCVALCRQRSTAEPLLRVADSAARCARSFQCQIRRGADRTRSATCEPIQVQRLEANQQRRAARGTCPPAHAWNFEMCCRPKVPAWVCGEAGCLCLHLRLNAQRPNAYSIHSEHAVRSGPLRYHTSLYNRTAARARCCPAGGWKHIRPPRKCADRTLPSCFVCTCLQSKRSSSNNQSHGQNTLPNLTNKTNSTSQLVRTACHGQLTLWHLAPGCLGQRRCRSKTTWAHLAHLQPLTPHPNAARHTPRPTAAHCGGIGSYFDPHRSHRAHHGCCGRCCLQTGQENSTSPTGASSPSDNRGSTEVHLPSI